jgi:hypothetical protein
VLCFAPALDVNRVIGLAIGRGFQFWSIVSISEDNMIPQKQIFENAQKMLFYHCCLLYVYFLFDTIKQIKDEFFPSTHSTYSPGFPLVSDNILKQ